MDNNSDLIVPTDANSVSASRTGTRQYVGRNARGAKVRVGMGPGEFSPGELMKIALATCNGLSIDHRLAKEFGEDFEATIVCATAKPEGEERYSQFDVQVTADFASLSPERREKLAARAQSAIERGCTVGNTIEKGADVRLHLLDAEG
ncbi:MAG: OsmC family protein [Actinomycetaceae bacterium]|nr:OsmC family protein [Actinomycetaceae bacterium]